MAMKKIFVFFDLVGTLIYPDPPVLDVYHRYGQKYGSALHKNEIQTRFKTAFHQHFTKSKQKQTVTSEDIEIKRWKSVINQVFNDVPDQKEKIFNELWSYFSKADSWGIYTETSDYIQKFLDRNIFVGIASNFDQRIVKICKTHFPAIDKDRIYYSTEIGYAKPDPRFYKTIEQQINIPSAEFIMIGDDIENDILAAEQAGWFPVHNDKLSELTSRIESEPVCL